MSRPQNTEVDAYVFIKNNLKTLGWDIRNPARVASGRVYTQNEVFAHEVLKRFLGLDKPENVVKISDTIFWVIESKRDHKQLDQAVQEAEDYARKINDSDSIQALFVSGVAGNELDSYLIKTRYLESGKFKTVQINGKEATSLLSPEIVQTVLEGGPEIKDVPIDEQLFLTKAEKINQILHLGAINKNLRARVMAAVLLAMIDDTPPNIDAPPSVLIGDINSRVRRVLSNHNKGEFFRYIELALPATEDNHTKFKNAIVQTIQELNNLNIRSAMNSGADVLGKFYEVFLKYGNGAKEIGIVLTPRHITQFAVDVLNITDRDVVFDPTCGTGGFLVAAFDHVRRNSTEVQVNRFKNHNLFGVDQETDVVALAIVNMIFRGDGKNNIVEGNCFSKNLKAKTVSGAPSAKYVTKPADPEGKPVTRVLMNPPFALKASDEKEYRFVDHALNQMTDGGVLFSVLPYSSMVRPAGYQRWRDSSLLKNNTLLSVITFPEDLFYPVGVHTVGVFIKKGIPHSKDDNVLWIRATHDGLVKSKGKRLPSDRVKNDYEVIRNDVQAFLFNTKHRIENIQMFQKVCPVDFNDPLLELVPENYLDQDPPSESEITSGIEQVVRNSVAFLIESHREDEAGK